MRASAAQRFSPAVRFTKLVGANQTARDQKGRRPPCYDTDMASVTLREALTRLADLIDEATKRTVVIVSGDRAVKLTPVRSPQHRARHFGSAVGRVHLARDFDEPLTDFAEYTWWPKRWRKACRS